MVKPLKSEILDQMAHVLVAILLMALFVFFPGFAAAMLVMAIGCVRELSQHDWEAVGKLDLIFWAVGCGVFLVAYYLMYWLIGSRLFTIVHFVL